MSSIYQQVLGDQFAQLHPQIQRRFSLTAHGGVASIGTGTMDRVWHGAPYTLPFLVVGTWRAIMFPEHGQNIPFTIQNYAYLDALGRETVTWVRTFQSRRTRRFDAYMILSRERGCIVDYLGTHQHLAVDIEMAVDPATRGLRLHSGAQRFYEGPIGFRFPPFFSGVADVCEWYDDEAQCFRIEVIVSNPIWGKLFGYTGRFQVEWKAVTPGFVPPGILPRRVEPRT